MTGARGGCYRDNSMKELSIINFDSCSSHDLYTVIERLVGRMRASHA